MKRIRVWLVALMFALLPVACVGCMAGSGADLMGYDAIIAAAQESSKGVIALDIAVRTADERGQEEMLRALRDSILIASKATSQPEGAAEVLATRIVDAMRAHLANYAENDRRRRDISEAVLDNLAYIIEVSDASKQFVLYRADIGEQWKSYITATARRSVVPSGIAGNDLGTVRDRVVACPIMSDEEKATALGLLDLLNAGQ